MKKVDIKEDNNKRNKEEEKIWHKQQEQNHGQDMKNAYK